MLNQIFNISLKSFISKSGLILSTFSELPYLANTEIISSFLAGITSLFMESPIAITSPGFNFNFSIAVLNGISVFFFFPVSSNPTTKSKYFSIFIASSRWYAFTLGASVTITSLISIFFSSRKVGFTLGYGFRKLFFVFRYAFMAAANILSSILPISLFRNSWKAFWDSMPSLT